MKESRIVTYSLLKVGNGNAFERSLVKIDGVLNVKVDQEGRLLKYEIDEWASDYDIFTEVMRIAEECGMEINFDDDAQNAQPDSAILPEEENEDIIAIKQEEVGDIIPEVEEKEEKTPSKKERSGLSERIQRIIELSVALACYVVALFLNDIPQYIFLAIAFAVAGYDALYEAVVKITKKVIFSEELLITVAFFASIFLGYAKYAVIAGLLYSIVVFAKKIVREELEKDPIFAKGDQTVGLVTEDGIKKVEISEVEVGCKLDISAGYVTPFDVAVCESATVKNFKGEIREVGEGDIVYAGERIESDMQAMVIAIGEDCKFGKYNQFIKDASKNNSPLASAFEKHSQLINAGIFALSLLIAFICPLFSKDYSSALNVWAYRAIIIASVGGLSFYTFSSEMNLLSALMRSKKCKLAFNGYQAIVKTQGAKSIFIDYEGALLDSDGLLKADAVGAIRELKDSKFKDISLACNLSDDKAEEVCKKLKIKNCYVRASKEEKLAEMKKALDGGAICITDAENAQILKGEGGSLACLNCESQGYLADLCISSDEIAYFPYAVKLAKRTAKIQKFNFALGLTVKIALVVLALIGIADLWWAVLADSLVSVICAVNGGANAREVY